MTVSSDPQARPPGPPPARPGLTTGIVTGLITAAVALGVGQLVAGITGPQGSPVIAVGSAAIDLTPPPLKNFAISTFGSNDKTALVTGILVLLAVFAAAIGVAAFHRLSYGVAGLAVFTGIGLAAALTRPTSQPADILPSLAGAVAGLLTLIWLVRAANADAAARTSQIKVNSPAAAPASEGKMSADCEVGRVSAAARPIPVNTARPATP